MQARIRLDPNDQNLFMIFEVPLYVLPPPPEEVAANPWGPQLDTVWVLEDKSSKKHGDMVGAFTKLPIVMSGGLVITTIDTNWAVKNKESAEVALRQVLQVKQDEDMVRGLTRQAVSVGSRYNSESRAVGIAKVRPERHRSTFQKHPVEHGPCG